jgi:NADH-quinone oxidoreductase subunit L
VETLLWIVLFAPAAGAALNGFFGARLGKGPVSWIACGAVGVSFIASAGAVYQLATLPAAARSFQTVLYNWIGAGELATEIGLLLDPVSAVMILVVSGVSAAIHIYSTGYMADDKRFALYFTYLNLFVFCMLLLVLSNNFLLFFVGWEGVGLCSYLLIGFWFEKATAADAGKKAFIVNRIGDFGFLLAIMAIFAAFGTLQFDKVFAAAPTTLVMGGGLAMAITLLLFMGATGKSAQIPLYTWLPDAMEGPTPVSALIHAATMVTAGVYMVVRCHVLFELAPTTMAVVAGVGVATAVFAASIALVQNDIKRVLAYSTVSQLGYMFLACGVGAYAAGMFHLMTHAFFKALLFLGAGSVMHALSGELDMRNMGGLKKYMPYTYWTFLAGALALSGVFPLSGFFSKDEILWHALEGGNVLHWAIGVGGALMTAFYVFRLFFLAFHGSPRSKAHPHESPMNMTAPLVFLAVLSVGGGLLGLPWPEGGGVIQKFLAPAVGGGHGSAHVMVEPAGGETSHADQERRGAGEEETSSLSGEGSERGGESAGLPSSDPGAAHREGGEEASRGGSAGAEAQGEDERAADSAGHGTEHGGVQPEEEYGGAAQQDGEHGAGEPPAEQEEVEHGAGEPVAEHGGMDEAAGHAAGHGGEAPFSEPVAMVISLAVALAGITTAWRIYLAAPEVSTKIRNSLRWIHKVLFNKYYVDEIYDNTVVKPVIGGARGLWHGIDEPVIDGGVNGLAKIVALGSAVLSWVQAGKVQLYALSVLLGAIGIAAYYLLR